MLHFTVFRTSFPLHSYCSIFLRLHSSSTPFQHFSVHPVLRPRVLLSFCCMVFCHSVHLLLCTYMSPSFVPSSASLTVRLFVCCSRPASFRSPPATSLRSSVTFPIVSSYLCVPVSPFFHSSILLSVHHFTFRSVRRNEQ